MPNMEPIMTSEHIVAELEGELALRTHDFEMATDRRPRLAVVTNLYEGPTQKYMKYKNRAGVDLGFDIHEAVLPASVDPRDTIDQLAQNETIDGIIVQLPLSNPQDTEAVLAHVPPEKDVDGLGPNPVFEPATPQAILRLIEAYVPEDRRKLTIVGRGLLVGAPLARIALLHGFDVESFDQDSDRLDIIESLNNADIIVGATGKSGLLTPELFDSMEEPRVLIDAGTAERSGSMVGDVSDELFMAAVDNDWMITPPRGGVGPLTIRCLLKSTIAAAELRAGLVNKVSS